MVKKIIKKKSPSGRLLVHRVKKKAHVAYCRICGTKLRYNIRKKTKSGKYAERPYAGEICHSCLEVKIQSTNL